MTGKARKSNPGAFTSRRARLAGYAAAEALTPDQRHDRARKAGLASGVARLHALEAAGKTVTQGSAHLRPSVEVMDFWLEEVDRLYPNAEWTNEQRKSQAIRLLRASIARDEFAHTNDK